MPRTPGNDAPAERPAALWAAWAVALLALVAAAGSIGGPHGPGTALAAVLETAIRSGWPAATYLATAAGLGWVVARAVPNAGRHVRTVLGLAILLTLSHALGVLGLLNTWSAGALSLLGVGAWLVSLRRVRRIGPPPGWLWVGLPGLALLLTAAASPPGALWSSEYGAYDVLSYHLQLPQEWVRAGSTAPVEHNVYSFLPGYLEHAYAHLAWLSAAPTEPTASGAPAPALLAGGGWRLMSAHYLHAGLTLLASALLARFARRMAIAAGLTPAARRVAPAVAGGLVLCTPWTIVVGSIAYNEMGVLVLGAGALLTAARRGPRPGVQAALVGVLVGVACCVKPTALFLVGVPAGVLLLRFLSWGVWARAVLAGSIAGTLALAPWLIRNTATTGNPVFPLATDLLGTGHWTADQAARWTAAHAFDGSIPDRLRLAIWADPAVPPNANPVARFRGLTNPQWFLAFPAGIIAGLALLIPRGARPIAAGLLLALAGQIAAWLAFTHIQSRFLLPCLIVLAPLTGIAAGAWRYPRRLAPVAGVVLCLAQAAAAWTIFAGERAGSPNALLVPGPAVFLAEPYSPELAETSPTAYVNHELPPDARVLLLGGATPLYLTRDATYATVWDRNPILEDPDAALARHDYILIDFAELARQRASGYLDPAFTRERLEDLTARLRPLRRWPSLATHLYRLPEHDR